MTLHDEVRPNPIGTAAIQLRYWLTRAWIMLWPAQRRQPPTNWWTPFSGHPDPLAALIDHRRTFRYRIYIGFNGENHEPWFADDESPVLVVGGPGSAKSTALGVTNVLIAPGAVVCISSRADIFRATALVRARLGRVYVVDFDGDTYMPGATRLRFNPLEGCEDWTIAAREARRWATMIDTSEAGLMAMAAHPHFMATSEQCLTGLFFCAAHLNYDIGQVLAVLESGAPELVLEHWRRSMAELADMGVADARRGAERLAYLLHIPREEQGSVITTASTMLMAYSNPAVVEAANAGEFDFDAFVAGRPDEALQMRGWGSPVLSGAGLYSWVVGSYDTVYVIDTDSESPTRYLLAAFMDKVREAMYRLSKQCERDGLARPMPMLMFNDEMGVAPPRHLRQTLAEVRDRGILLCGVVQSIAQLEAVLGARLTKDAMGLWRNIVVLRGVRDPELLDLISTLAGKYWQETISVTVDKDGKQNRTRSYTEMDVLRPDQIAHGHPEWPDGALFLDSHANYHWIVAVPYFRGPVWPMLMVNSLEQVIARPTKLPLPPLARDGDFINLEALGLADRFRDLQQRHAQY